MIMIIIIIFYRVWSYLWSHLLQQPSIISSMGIVISILPMRKLELEKVKWLTQSHRAIVAQSQDSNPVLDSSLSEFYSTCLAATLSKFSLFWSQGLFPPCGGPLMPWFTGRWLCLSKRELLDAPWILPSVVNSRRCHTGLEWWFEPKMRS